MGFYGLLHSNRRFDRCKPVLGSAPPPDDLFEKARTSRQQEIKYHEKMMKFHKDFVR
jgi:hypothetical protein